MIGKSHKSMAQLFIYIIFFIVALFLVNKNWEKNWINCKLLINKRWTKKYSKLDKFTIKVGRLEHIYHVNVTKKKRPDSMI